MKFNYQYRTSDNQIHSGVIKAASREAAYAALKAHGVKPSRVDEAPGVFNKLFGKGKRWIAIGVLVLTCAVLIVVLRDSRTDLRPISTLDAPTRRQVIGDIAVVEKGIRTGWSNVFALEGERYLASYAIPGYAPAIMSVPESDLLKVLDSEGPSSLDGAALEERQVRAIVAGMKAELREYLAAGGTCAKYAMRLKRRQQIEIGYFQQAEREINEAAKSKMSASELEALWEKRNNGLRTLGIRLVPMPESKPR